MTIFAKHKLILLLSIFILCGEKSIATAQFPDLLIDGKDTVAIFSNPLEQYLDKKRKRTLCGEELEWTSTACYRGYQATWIIQNDSLLLLNIKHGCGDDSQKYFDLKKEFNTDKKVFAKWFTGQIRSPRGSLLRYFHDGYASIYEKEKFFSITKGKVNSEQEENYLIYDKNLLNPSIQFLSDTLYELILSNLNISLFQNISENEACGINIRFSSNGKIDSIYNEYTYDGESITEKYILAVAKQSLKNLPRLMKVTHKDYRPPRISLFFSGHCLKYPWDTQYGCPKSKKYSHEPAQVKKDTFINRNAIWTITIITIILSCGLVLFILYKRHKS